MWILVLFIVNINTGSISGTKLNDYSTRMGCVLEQARIAYEMRVAYPTEHDYYLDCIPAPKVRIRAEENEYQHTNQTKEGGE